MASTPFPVRASTRFRDFKQYRNLVWAIYGALCVGLATLIGVGYFVMQNLPDVDAKMAAQIDRRTLLIAACVTSVIAVGFATTLPLIVTRKIAADQIELRLKSALFAVILFAAALEAGGMLWGVIGLLVRDPLYLLGGVAALAVMLGMFPTTRRLEWVIERSASEIDRHLANTGINS